MTSIVFFGTGPVAAASLDFLRSKFDIEAIITKPRVTGFKGNTPVEDIANHHKLPLHFAAKRSELDSVFNNNDFESALGVVVDFGIIISPMVIDSFEKGIVNSHFSLLPRWRGADPISYTILSGDERTGVSLMVIDEGLDTGKLITQKVLHIDPKETTGTLTKRLIALSNELLNEYLFRYASGEITPKSQPHPDRVTHSHKLSKADSVIDWNEPAEVIERKIRAFQPWPQSRTNLKGLDLIITGAHVEIGESLRPGEVRISPMKRLHVGTAQGLLVIDSLKPAGKKEMPISAFLAGHRQLFSD